MTKINLYEAVKKKAEKKDKPYILSSDEYDVVDKVMTKSGMIDAFFIGNFDYDGWDQDKQGDAWWDFDENKRIPLEDGIHWMYEGFTSPEDYDLTEKEWETLKNLWKKFGIEVKEEDYMNKLSENIRMNLQEDVKDTVDLKELSKKNLIVYTNDDNNTLYYIATSSNMTNFKYNKFDSYISWDLELIGGKDYIDVDDKYNNKRGIIGPENFNNDVQNASFNQYYIQESFYEAAEANDYKVYNRI